MIKLIASDLDNTLLDKNKRIPNSTKKIISKVIDKDIYFIPATGRSFESARAMTVKANLNSLIICYNGSEVRNLRGDYIYSNFLEPCLVKKVIKFAKENHIYAQIYDNDNIIVERKCPKLHDDPDMKYANTIEVGQFDISQELKIPKILLAQKSNLIPEIFKELKNKYGGEVSVTISEPHLIEITPNGVNKGTALNQVQKYLNISLEETMAIGDNLNDLEMLMQAKIKVAVNNSVDDLKKIANYVTKADRSLGVNEALEKFVL